MELEKVSRKEAKEKGLKYYFTGKPCKYGHTYIKYVSNSRCLKCLDKTRETVLEQKRKSNKKCYNKESETLRARNYRKQFPERTRLTRLKRKAQRKDRWQKRNAQKKQALPKWANVSDINIFYQNSPKGHHVDHIVPFKGVNVFGEHVVCGLHVLHNLQYLLIKDNLEKSNKFESQINDTHDLL